MAIAFDNATSGTFGANVASKTLSHTVNSNSNGILFVGVAMSGAVTTDIVTGITYNGVSMTKVADGLGHTGNLGDVTVYYLLAPASGANNVIVSFSPNNGGAVQVISYTGAKQSGQPDSSAVRSNGGAGSFTLATTTVADNSWAVLFGQFDGGATPTAGTNTTLRGSIISSVFAMGDTNGVVHPAGSITMGLNNTSGSNSNGVIVSIAPTATAVNSAFFMAASH